MNNFPFLKMEKWGNFELGTLQVLTFLISLSFLVEASNAASELELSEGTGLWTYFLKWDPNLDLGDLEKMKGLGLKLDLGAGWEGRVEEYFEIVCLTILPLHKLRSNTSCGNREVEGPCDTRRFFLLDLRASAIDAYSYHFLLWVWGVLGEAEKLCQLIRGSSSSTRMSVDDLFFLDWDLDLLETTSLIWMSSVSTIWREGTSVPIGFGKVRKLGPNENWENLFLKLS